MELSSKPLRIVLFTRFCLAETYELSAEFPEMLRLLAARAEVLHIGSRSLRGRVETASGIQSYELPLTIDRSSNQDIKLKYLLLILLLPLAAWRIRKFKPDLVFIPEILPLCPLIFTILTGRKVAAAYGDWHIHNYFGRKQWMKPLLGVVEWLERFEARRLAGFQCRAKSAGERLVSWGVSPDCVRVVRDAPDLRCFAPSDQSALRKRCGFAPDDVVLLYHGVMHQGKGLDKLLEWTAELHREDSRFGIIMVGDGPESPELRKLAERVGLKSRAYFTGWLKEIREVGDYCNAADICIAMRTATEANDKVVPGATLHSMACGRVVVGPALRGVAEIIRHSDNGFMFKPDDREDFLKLMRYLAANRALWPEVGRRAHEDILRNFTIGASAKAYSDALIHFASR